MEFVLLGLLVLSFPIIAIVALVKAINLKTRLDAIEQRFAALDLKASHLLSSAPAKAATTFDGSWNVSIASSNAACTNGQSVSIGINNGQVASNNAMVSASGRVADAPSENFVYRMLPAALWPYAQLARWDRPIGWQLLLWPCLWSATLAPQWAAPSAVHTGLPSFLHLLLFLLGAVAMRGAGCTYNDLVDHEIDNQVARTRSRPLPSGRVSRRQAKLFLAAQLLAGFLVLIQFNGL